MRRANYRMRGLGAYGVDDPNAYPGGVDQVGTSYDPTVIWKGAPGGQPVAAVNVNPLANISGAVAPYSLSLGAKSVRIIAANPNGRSYLMIQNQSLSWNL